MPNCNDPLIKTNQIFLSVNRTKSQTVFLHPVQGGIFVANSSNIELGLTFCSRDFKKKEGKVWSKKVDTGFFFLRIIWIMLHQMCLHVSISKIF